MKALDPYIKPRAGRRPRRRYKTEIEKGRYVVNPDWENSEACRDEVMRQCEALSVRLGGGMEEFSNYYPQDYGKQLPSEGGWIVVQKPPATEFTVPPFSIWYATNWQMDCGEISGVKPKRVKIITPMGNLGVMPHEYAICDIKQYLGREKEGVLFRKLDGNAVFPTDQLFYLQSRGIRRDDACMMLLDQMHDPTFGWFEVAPPYGAYFGQEWPAPAKCPFATPLDRWVEDGA